MDRIRINKDIRGELARQGFSWIPWSAWSLGYDLEPHWQRLALDWDRLEPDRYLQDGAKFRLRRYGRFSWSPAQDALTPLPHEPYFQPEDENAYAGGVVRQLAPLLPGTPDNPFLHALVRATFACLPVAGRQRETAWEVRVHQIRIVASPGSPGLPAPEGIHQDGTDFLTLHLVRRRNVAGAESTVYDLERRPLCSYTFREPLDSVILEDPRVLHGVTPVYPADGKGEAVRDLLGLDFLYGRQR
jgi:hypothetical protein